MLIVNYDQEDIDRFSILVQPDLELLARLRDKENVLIKYHKNKQQYSSDINSQRSKANTIMNVNNIDKSSNSNHNNTNINIASKNRYTIMKQI